MVTFGEILRFDPEQINAIFTACSGQQRTCANLDGHLKKLSDLHTWVGDAATAAKNAANKTRVDVDTHGNEVWQVAAAARDCYDEAVALKASARRVQADADADGVDIDSVTGNISDPHPPDMRDWSDEEKRALFARRRDLQRRDREVIAAAERFDDDLAAAINAADGTIPMTPRGEGANVNLADRRANQIAAFRQMYHRDPTTENDWRMAEVLDPHSYSAKNKGASANIVVGRFTPQPGRGVVAINAFIPRDKVANIGAYDLGDNRQFNPHASPESNRATIYIDYDSGLIVARQNPSVGTDGDVEVGKPVVSASESENGQLNIKYKFTNPSAPGGERGADIIRETVRGAVAIPGGDSPPSVNGTMSGYPAIEVYGYTNNGSGPQTIYQYKPGGKASIDADSSLGPALNLPLDRVVGDDGMYPQVKPPKYASLDPYYIPPPPLLDEGTPLGPRTEPPTIEEAPQ